MRGHLLGCVTGCLLHIPIVLISSDWVALVEAVCECETWALQKLQILLIGKLRVLCK